MSKVLLVAWREFKHTALTKAFIFGAVFTPVLLLVVIAIVPLIMKPNLTPLHGTLAVVDPTLKLKDAIVEELSSERVTARHRQRQEDFARNEIGSGTAMNPTRTPDLDQAREVINQAPVVNLRVETFDSGADVAGLKDRVRLGEYTALAIIDEGILEPKPARHANAYELFVPSGTSPNHTRVLEDAIDEAVVRARVELDGGSIEDVRALVAKPQSLIKRITPSGDEARENPFVKDMIPMGFMFLIWITTFASGNYLLTSTIEEKSNKVIEVLLSAVSPMQLMAGKILGQAFVSAIMLIMYGGLAIAAMAVFAMMDLVPVIHLVYLVLFFIMAYFMIASMMAGVGSAVNELRDAQSLITPAMMVLMIPLLLWFPISEHPNGLLATITSFIPPLIPFVMILRVTAANEPVATWQVIASLVWGYASMLGMIWMCAKIFRIGILMYGKPPSPLELIRWLRYS